MRRESGCGSGGLGGEGFAGGGEDVVDLGGAVGGETKAASNCEGGSQTPASSMARWKRPKAAVSEVAAVVVVGDRLGVKNQVNMEPTRLVVSGMPASRGQRGDAVGDGFGGGFELGIDVAAWSMR